MLKENRSLRNQMKGIKSKSPEAQLLSWKKLLTYERSKKNEPFAPGRLICEGLITLQQM